MREDGDGNVFWLRSAAGVAMRLRIPTLAEFAELQLADIEHARERAHAKVDELFDQARTRFEQELAITERDMLAADSGETFCTSH